MLRKMYLVPAEKYPAVPKHSPTAEAPTQSLSISSSSTSAKEEEKEYKETETAPLRKVG